MGYGDSSVHQRKNGVREFPSGRIAGRRTEGYRQQWTSCGPCLGWAVSLSIDQLAQLVEAEFARATFIRIREGCELLGRSGRDFLRMLTRRAATVGDQSGRQPQVDDEPDPLGESIEKYPGRRQRPAGHVDPEPGPLSR